MFTRMAKRRRRGRLSKRRAPAPPARLGAGEARLLTLARDLTALITTAPPSRLLDAALERLPAGARPVAQPPNATSRGGQTEALAPAGAPPEAATAPHHILLHEPR